MIYHIFNGNVLHLTPTIIKGIIDKAGVVSPSTQGKHCFLITTYEKQMLYDNVDKNPYDQLFKNYSNAHYRLL